MLSENGDVIKTTRPWVSKMVDRRYHVASISRQFREPIYWNAHASSSFDHAHWGYNSVFKQIRRFSVDGRKRYENDKCGRKSFWKRSKTAPFRLKTDWCGQGLIAWLVVVFGNNAASDIFQNCPLSDICRILKYYEPLLLQNITYRSCYYLLIMEAEKFSVTYNARSETFISLRLKKQTRAVCIGNNIFTSTQWKEKWSTFFYWWI